MWDYLVRVRCTDITWAIEESTINVNVIDNESPWFWVSINWRPLSWPWPLTVNLEPRIEWWKWPFSCEWDYGDGNTWKWLKVTYIFNTVWDYLVRVRCVDNSTWAIEESTINVNVIDNEPPWFWRPSSWTPSSWIPSSWIPSSWIPLGPTISGPITLVPTNRLNIQIEVNPILWFWSLNSQLEWIVVWWKWPYIYKWDFWDWSGWYEEKLNHIFNSNWTYRVVLEVTDSLLNKGESIVLLKVINWTNDTDTDWDEVIDVIDKCPLEKWELDNLGCPIIERKCGNDWSCPIWYFCSEKLFSNKVCLPLEPLKDCNYNWNTSVFWKVTCNSCPCSNSLDFIAPLRKCDIVFPAITSIDGKDIYSRWNLFNINK